MGVSLIFNNVLNLDYFSLSAALLTAIITSLLLLLTRLNIKPRKILPLPDSYRFPRSLELIFILSFHDHHHQNTKPCPNFSDTLFSRLYFIFYFFLTLNTRNFSSKKNTQARISPNPHRRVIKLEIPPH